jgi:thiamine biosynthesis protein ThiI
MEMVTRVLATTHEISLKGGNRRWFERALTANVRQALADLPVAAVSRPAWRVLVELEQPVPFLEVARRLGTVFGLQAIAAVEHGGQTLDDLERLIASRLEGLRPSSFAVRCTRSDKSFPMTSVDIERHIGAFIVERTGWPVRLSDPELTFNLLLDAAGFHLWFRKVLGPGGLPVGVSGRGLCLLSGGIDSPVSAYMMMKRGMQLDFVHFHSVPRTDPASLEKVEDLARLLMRYQGRARLALVPLLPIQEQIVASCPQRLRILLYRRFMLRLAAAICRRFKARAMITGESLGQVASQTIENLNAVAQVTRTPLLRPLIGLDKQEIIALARRAGSYDISIRPHLDCCSFLTPEHPATRSQPEELDAAESALDVDALIAHALESAEIRTLTKPAPWPLIPPPAGSA